MEAVSHERGSPVPLGMNHPASLRCCLPKVSGLFTCRFSKKLIWSEHCSKDCSVYRGTSVVGIPIRPRPSTPQHFHFFFINLANSRMNQLQPLERLASFLEAFEHPSVQEPQGGGQREVQGYLAHKKSPPPTNLQLVHA